MNTPISTKPPAAGSSRGFVNPARLRLLSFLTITICIFISVTACILAIWDFAGRDTLWRTVATCIVISGGMMAFGIVNSLYGSGAEKGKRQ